MQLSRPVNHTPSPRYLLLVGVSVPQLEERTPESLQGSQTLDSKGAACSAIHRHRVQLNSHDDSTQGHGGHPPHRHHYHVGVELRDPCYASVSTSMDSADGVRRLSHGCRPGKLILSLPKEIQFCGSRLTIESQVLYAVTCGLVITCCFYGAGQLSEALSTETAMIGTKVSKQ